MNFERLKEFNQTPDEESERPSTESAGIEKALESKFGRSLKCLRTWGTLGVAVGAFLFLNRIEKQLEHKDHEWKDYVSASLDETALEKKKLYESRIVEFFGDQAIEDIETGDKDSYFERKNEQRDEPTVTGFAERGWTNMSTYAFTEKHKIYPRGWVNGEVGEIKFIDSIEDVGKQRLHGSLYTRGLFVEKPTMYLHRAWGKNIGSESVSPVSSKTICHEFAHANDWETDMDLNLLERHELLLKVHERMLEKDAFHREADHYHEDFIDGTKEGLYKAAREYWADICSEYFSNPVAFQENNPKDFILVDEYTKKNDPSFDVFDEDRGAFDTETGKLKDVWKNK